MVGGIGVRRGESKGVEDGRRPPALKRFRGGSPVERRRVGYGEHG
jgi:hypothetical protein